MADQAEVKELVEKVTTGLTNFQSDLDAKSEKYDKYIVDNDEALKKHGEDVAQLTEDLQKANDAIEAEKQALEAEKKTIQRLQQSIATGTHAKFDGQGQTDPEVKTASDLYMRSTKQDHVISDEVHEKNVEALVKHYMPHLPESKQEAQIKKIMTEGAFTSGGMFCPVGMATDIDRRVFETTPIMDMATVIDTSNSSMEFPGKDELPEVNKGSETSDRKQSSVAGFFKVKIETNELNAEPMITQWMRDDSSIDIEGEIAQDTADEFSRQMNTQFINGNGDEEAKGIMSAIAYPDAPIDEYQRGKLGTLTSGTAQDFDDEDLIDLQANLLEPYQPNAQWLMHRLSWAKCLKLKDSEGRYLLDAMALLRNNVAPQLLGANVRLGGDMAKPESGSYTSGQRIMAYGDFSKYYVLRRIGINMIVDPFTQKGFIKYFMYTRIGGGLRNYQSIKRLKVQ